MNSHWATIVQTSGAKVYSLVVGLITLALTARILGPEGRGQVAVITTWVAMFSTFACLSLGQVALHRMARDNGHKRFGYLLGSLLLLTSLLTITGWIGAVGLYVHNPEGNFKGQTGVALLVGFLALPFMIWEQYSSSLLTGLARLGIYNKYQVLGRTTTVIALFFLVGWLGLGVSAVLAANLVGQIIVAIGGIGFLLTFARDTGVTCKPQKAEMMALLLGGAKLHLNAIGAFLITSANVLILNNYHGAEQTGYFQLATQLLGLLMIIPTSVSMVIYGKVTKLGPNEAWEFNKRLLWQITIVMMVLCAFAALLAPWGIAMLAGEKFLPAAPPFQWMLLGVIGMTFSTLMAPQWIGRGYFWQTAILTLLVGGINLVCNFWLIPLYGMQGAVYAFLGTYIFSMLSNGVMVWHCQKLTNKPI